MTEVSLPPRCDALELSCGLICFGDDRRILSISAYAAELLGYEPESLRGQSLNVLLSPAARMFFNAQLFPSLAVTDHVEEVYVSLRTRSGAELPVLLNAKRCHSELASLNQCTFLPMRRRNLFERELIESQEGQERAVLGEQAALARVREIQEQLAVSERLSALGTLAAGVAHEINNPLAYVAGNLELLRDVLYADPGVKDELEPRNLVTEALEGVYRIRGIVSSLRTLSRVDEQRRVPTELDRVIDVAVRMVRHEVRQRATLEVDLAEPGLVVEGDEGRLSQVVINLLINALQALPERRETNRVRIATYAEAGGQAVIEVSDNGCGIPEELQARIFEPFFTTKPPGQGTGLGLPICHGIVSALGGELRVRSRPGEGATFSVSLPTCTCSVVPSSGPSADAHSSGRIALQARPERDAREPGTRRPRVLAVDDDQLIGRVITRLLKDYDVCVETRSSSALERVRAGERFELVLCDVMMPDMDGIELYEAFKEVAPELARKMIFLTGGASSARARTFLQRVARRQLMKPFEASELRALCSQVLQRS